MKSILNIVPAFFIVLQLQSQTAIKVRREDNRFLFFQTGKKNDTIIKNKTDLFIIRIPDSLKTFVRFYVENGQFIVNKADSIYRLISVPGMKYSHSINDTVFNTLLEGNCTPSKTITINFIRVNRIKPILSNKFIVK